MASAKSQSGWLPFREGDIVDIIAPGFACKPEELDGAIRFLREWGLKPRVPQKIFGRDVLCSSDDRTRFRHLREALVAEDSSGIWCLRGGYGSIRLVPELARLRKPKGRAKIFIGLSDITSLHVYLGQKWGWPTIHGPHLDRLGKGVAKPPYVRELKKFLFGESSEIAFDRLKPMNAEARKRGTIRASVTGGNLVTLQSSLSTPGHWETRGRILFFEELGERGYRVDRVFEHMRQAGMFDEARAIVFGDFTGGNEPDGRTRVPAVLQRFADTVGLPVFSGIKSGHDVVQRPVPFETPAELSLGERGKLVCQTGVSRGASA
jgi:muramoyltetrapeptide carboxypeptidase